MGVVVLCMSDSERNPLTTAEVNTWYVMIPTFATLALWVMFMFGIGRMVEMMIKEWVRPLMLWESVLVIGVIGVFCLICSGYIIWRDNSVGLPMPGVMED